MIQAHLAFHRIRFHGENQVNDLLNKLSRLKSLKDEEEKGILISQVFNLFGFESYSIDLIKKLPDFKTLNTLVNPDAIAYSFITRDLFIIEEKKKFTTGDFHKMSLIDTVFKEIPILGSQEEWNITTILIGKIDTSQITQIKEINKDKRLIGINHENFFENANLSVEELQISLFQFFLNRQFLLQNANWRLYIVF
jgi:hypothetical protein